MLHLALWLLACAVVRGAPLESNFVVVEASDSQMVLNSAFFPLPLLGQCTPG